MRRIPWLAIAAVALSACAGGSGTTTTTSSGGGPINIGLLTSLTGNYAPLGTNDKLAAEQMVSMINAQGGINGRKINLIEMDDQSDPTQTVIDYLKLVDQGVVAIEGPPQSTAELAMIPQVDIKKIPDVSVGAADQQVIPVHPYVFQTTPTSTQVATAIFKYFKDQNYTKIAMLTDTKNAYAVAGHQASLSQATQVGVSVVDDQTFELGQTNFAPQLGHIKGSAAQALLVWATGAPPVIITKQFKSNGLTMPLVMTAAEASPLYVNPAEPEVEGTIVEVSLGVLGPFVPASSKYKKLIDAFAGPFQKANNYYPPQFAWDSMVAMSFIFDAIKRKGATPDQIQAGLESINLDTPEGHYTFSKTKHYGLPDSSNLMAVVKDKNFTPLPATQAALATAGN